MSIIKNLSIIAAIGKNYELGYKNDLIWRIKEDLKFFKDTTMNSYIVMGRKTYNSLPILPKRKYIVLSNSNIISKDRESEVLLVDNLYETFCEIDDNPSKKYLLNFLNSEKLKLFLRTIDEKAFIIGGSSIYRQFLNSVETMYLTEIEAEFSKADVYFPEFDKNEWEVEQGPKLEADGISYTHVLYKRKNGRK